MPKPQDTMIHAFAAQFREQDGFVFYRRLSFLAPWLGTGPNYIVTREERDRFVADFNRDAPEIFLKMERDLWKAVGSLVFSSFLLHSFAGEWFTVLEQALFFAHLAVIFVVENRRLNSLWNAPALAIGSRAPVDFAVGGRLNVFLPMSKLRKRDLAGGVFTGILALNILPGMAMRPMATMARPEFQLGALAIGIIMLAVGVTCGVELARRILR